MQIDLKLQHDLLAVETEHDVHAMVELNATIPPAEADRTPLSVALVVDRSGSMQGEKLDTVRRCVAFLIDQLDADDQIALVTYDDEAQLLAPLTPTLQRAALRQALAGLDVGGMTNLSGGWLKGLEQLQPVGDDRARRLVLLTDGQANQGITGAGELCGLARQAAASGIGTTTIGFGDDFHEELLTAMADAGRGNAHFAETVDDAPGIFADEFAGLIALVAQNISVEIRPSADVELLGVLNESPTVGVDGGMQIQIGDAYAGQRLRAVVRLHVPELAGLGPAKLADVVIRYVAVGDVVAQHEVTYPLHVNLVSADEASTVTPDPDVTEEVTVLLAAKATDEARRRAEEGDLSAARHILDEAVSNIRAVVPNSDRAEALMARADDLEGTSEMLASKEFNAADSKRLHYRSHEMKRNRW